MNDYPKCFFHKPQSKVRSALPYLYNAINSTTGKHWSVSLESHVLGFHHRLKRNYNQLKVVYLVDLKLCSECSIDMLLSCFCPQTSLPVLDNPLSARIQNIIRQIQNQRKHYLKLTVVRQRDKLEGWFKHFLVEDKGVNPAASSYVDFLCQMHKEIRSLMNWIKKQLKEGSRK